MLEIRMQRGYFFKQGDIGCCFFVIWSEMVRVDIEGKVVRSLGKGKPPESWR